MFLLMEDKAELPLSKGLSSYLNISFASSNSNIKRILKDNGNKNCIILVDVPAFNKKAVNVYVDLQKYVLQECTNCYVVPIVCSESFVVEAHCCKLQYNYTWLSRVSQLLLSGSLVGKPVPPRMIGYKESFYTEETQFKLCLNNTEDSTANALTCGQKYGTLGFILPIIELMPITIWKTGEIRKGIYCDIRDIGTYVADLQVKHDKHIKSVKKVTLPDKWWEEEYK